ncbi:3-deoxy-D-arabino-heptulosonate 7-phosphate (DAHP) synthase [Oleiphilus messinensis]|uniref:3-deoxy-D-arabino-heptulosonate 7-phosphate (DAHP) synthase n=1 Tax=Oleiphilus messinensis TaxID=141451 RepID=A0A1Y0IA73_9GAMM|nr:3-deoxy-7-phosphoheptulonate synthase [Oleiphilus messinensis]ARU56666.1 3-deoxy-D-arabino-heptulosonate 7-phosphate (DAHP) synthase [Oleiphilus messinensis]
MLIILQPDLVQGDAQFKSIANFLDHLPAVTYRVHEVKGQQQTLTEIYLLGDTKAIDKEQVAALPGVERVIRISDEYRILGRHKDDQRQTGFDYNGVHFGQSNLHVFAGLCAVDNPTNVETMMKALHAHGQRCTRMGAYKPRTNPYSFQGHGQSCLHYVFELAGKYDIKVIAMEITHESHIEEINFALEETGNPTGVMLQVGTRNTQNFELLKAIGRQSRFPVLLKRGFGITLNESLNAAEYLATEGNSNVIFCLRGMKTSGGNPHRNMVDFAHVPVVKRLTRMPVCIDPSHSVGNRESDPSGLLDVVNATAQGVIAGANMVLVDFHPHPEEALVDGPQALLLEELPKFLEDVQLCHETYQKRKEIYKQT